MTGRLFRFAAVIADLAAGSILAVAQGSPRANQQERADESPSRIAGVRVKLILKIIGALGVLALLGGLIVSASGVIPIKASSGHWAITRWFLQFSKERSVSANSLGISAPSLDDPALALKGAGHFETGCAPCHGSPALRQPRIAWKMTPHPPRLGANIAEWMPEELFYIVSHGIKFTGMPAWPSPQRDDEVWAMVAFLHQLPKLDAAAYQRLVNGEGVANAEAVPLAGLVVPELTRRVISESCARCHGFDGLGRGLGAFPKLAGQQAEYLLASMQAYANNERHSGIMEPVAAGLSDEALREVSEYYARLPRPTSAMQDALSVERGRLIAEQGIPRQRVPACVACHAATPQNPNYSF
jgi:cytochrome c553